MDQMERDVDEKLFPKEKRAKDFFIDFLYKLEASETEVPGRYAVLTST